MARRGWRSRWPLLAPSPLSDAPRPQGACVAPIYQGLVHSGWVPRGWGGCRRWGGGGDVGMGAGRDCMGLQRGAERRTKQKVTITKENTKKKNTHNNPRTHKSRKKKKPEIKARRTVFQGGVGRGRRGGGSGRLLLAESGVRTRVSVHPSRHWDPGVRLQRLGED